MVVFPLFLPNIFYDSYGRAVSGLHIGAYCAYHAGGWHTRGWHTGGWHRRRRSSRAGIHRSGTISHGGPMLGLTITARPSNSDPLCNFLTSRSVSFPRIGSYPLTRSLPGVIFHIHFFWGPMQVYLRTKPAVHQKYPFPKHSASRLGSVYGCMCTQWFPVAGEPICSLYANPGL